MSDTIPITSGSIATGLRGANVLITGGLGFIGSNLARRLVSIGADVTVVDNLIPEYGGNMQNVADIADRIRIDKTDVRDRANLEPQIASADYLFNLAGQTSHLDSMVDPHTDMEINAGAQLSILEACRHRNPGLRIVFASTRQLYGKPINLPVDEDHPINPVDVNGINKLSGELYHRLYSDVYGIHTVCLRMTNTYGPGMRVRDARQTFLGIWLKAALEDEPLLVYGDGAQLRDFNYVDDVVDALLMTALSDACKGKVYNLGSGEVVSLKNLAAMVVEQAGSGSFEMIDFPAARKKIDIGDYYGDYSSLAAAVGWQPRVELREGLQKTLDYYRRYSAEYW
mgnify:CR=1 FL=1